MNRIKTLILLAALTALVIWVGQALGGQAGLIIAMIIASVMNFGAYWFSDRIILRMYGAQEVTEAEVPGLLSIVRELSYRSNIPMPRVYLIPEEAPNAFATGRSPSHAAVAVTEGLLNILNREELAGVLAHELGHVKNRDTLIMTVTAAFSGAMSMLANAAMWGSLFGGQSSSDSEDSGHPATGLLGIIIAPLAAMMIQMAISRSREFLADEGGARLTGNPTALASALRKIESWSRQLPMSSGSQETAHLFIVNPFSGEGLGRLFSTHPSTEERIERLRSMAREEIALRVHERIR